MLVGMFIANFGVSINLMSPGGGEDEIGPCSFLPQVLF